MKRTLFNLFVCCFVSVSVFSQSGEIPQWFLNDMESNIGVWITDNDTYVSENEPYTQYGMEWRWGIGKTSIIGRLFGVVDGKETGDFWQFRQYWDNIEGKAVLVQFGNGGVTGIGTLYPINENTMESIQTFSLPDGTNWMDRHISTLDGEILTTTSYKTGASEEWEENRTYYWKKKS
ncbi:hypothetical protein [Constantimarinum furrinae]|uniref:DUF1579 domain-containing protein n=1 Tax=Constantimarinum furrinae TaxID=2562285 RepID=A0A7G8PVG1_9FLAO|nr:hypothetical protein [Constantimarinum furrinae]QNJ98327.1 hypothetical protein ALE3EI_1778 [Constantimarinum furrinae]